MWVPATNAGNQHCYTPISRHVVPIERFYWGSLATKSDVLGLVTQQWSENG